MNGFFQGIVINLALLAAPGVQNIMIFELSARKCAIWRTGGVAALCDFALLTLGIYGAGEVFSENYLLLSVISWIGGLMLISYGISALRSPGSPHHAKPSITQKTAITAAGSALVNPGAYFDTLGIVGSMGASFSPDGKAFFWLGTVSISFVWFVGLAKIGSALGQKGHIGKYLVILGKVSGIFGIGSGIVMIHHGLAISGF